MKRALVFGGLAGVAAGAFARYLVGFPWVWSVIFAVPVASFVVLAVRAIGVGVPNWHALPMPEDTLTVHEAAALSSRFAEASRDQQRFLLRVQPRLRQLAKHATGELDPELRHLLTSPDATMPDPATLAALLRRLEET
ncbi:hypothetical protein GCM10029964_006920 [Kibdelosporangium lantanae]